MNNFICAKYDNLGGVRDYILRIVWIATKLKKVKVLVVDHFLVHHILNCFPVELEQLKFTYMLEGKMWNR